MTHLAILSSSSTATPLCPPFPSVYITLTPSLVKSPPSFHLTSDSPKMSSFVFLISLITLASFPGLSIVLTFHVPILIFSLQGFRWMTTEEALFPLLPNATLPISDWVDSFTLLTYFFICAIISNLGKLERWFPVAFLSVFLVRHHLRASVTSTIRPSSSLVRGSRLYRRGLGRPPRTLFSTG